MSGLPDVYILNPRACGPQASGVHIRQITNAHVMCHNGPFSDELEVAQSRRYVSLQAHCIYMEGCWD